MARHPSDSSFAGVVQNLLKIPSREFPQRFRPNHSLNSSQNRFQVVQLHLLHQFRRPNYHRPTRDQIQAQPKLPPTSV